MSNTEPKVGQLRRKRLLGSEATYRVVAVEDDHVALEVVSAPGLTAGTKIRFTRDAVLSLDVVEEPRHARGGERAPASRRHATA